MDADAWRRCVRLSVTEGALATAMGTLVSGVFLTGFAISLGASHLTIGILAALPSLANIAQLAGAAWLSGGMHRKRLCVGSLAASRVFWLAALAVPLFSAKSNDWLIAGLIAIVAASSVLSSIGGVAWLSWIRDLVPAGKRLGFLGLRNQFDTILALAFGLAGGVFLDIWNANHPQSSVGFVAILMVAVACGLIGISVLNRIEDPKSERVGVDEFDLVRPKAPRHARSAKPRSPLAERNFRNLLAFYVVWNLASNLAMPFFAVFMLETLGLPFWKIMALQTLSSAMALLANRFWTALGERIGTRPVVFLAVLGDAFYPFCWLFLSPQTTWALPLVFLFGAFNTPLAVGGPTLVMRLAPDEQAPAYLATFNTVMGLIMGIAAIAGGWLVGGGSGGSASSALLGSSGIALVFAISFVGRLASLPLLARVNEPDSLPLAVLLKSAIGFAANKRGVAALASKVEVEPSPAETSFQEFAVDPLAEQATAV